MSLVISPCLALCAWQDAAPAPQTLEDLPLLTCQGCGSQWIRSEPWTPRDADGSVPPAVRREREVRSVGAAEVAAAWVDSADS